MSPLLMVSPVDENMEVPAHQADFAGGATPWRGELHA